MSAVTRPSPFNPENMGRDLLSGLVVFLVALPLCLGVALASNAPLISGILSGIIGGLVVGALSGSQTSVSGPAAGLTAILAAQIATLGSFPAFLTAVFLAGLIQIFLGLARAGTLSEYFPSSVIKGLLAAIGIILILKQIPHLFGHDQDPEGEMSFRQPDHENTFSELFAVIGDLHWGATAIGMTSFFILIFLDRIKWVKRYNIPGALIVVIFGISVKFVYDRLQLGPVWQMDSSHLVNLPIAGSLSNVTQFFTFPDFSQLNNPLVYTGAITIAIVASLETLLNLEAVDKLDPRGRTSPPNRELFAQGCGNLCAGLIGAIPVTSVIIRSSVNINSGVRTKFSTIFHGFLLAVCGIFLPQLMNQIPLSCLAAILIVTGIKLANPALFKQMWHGGLYEFAPFVLTTLAIVFTDLLYGILIGLAVSTTFILHSNIRRPIRRIMEKHVSGDVLRIELANQVSFLNRAALSRLLQNLDDGQQVLIDATQTDYMDPDVLILIKDFEQQTAPARGISVSLVGFKDITPLEDKIQFVDYTSKDVRDQMTPAQALEYLLEGNERFRNGKQIVRNLGRQVASTASGQFPMAVILSCIDSRTPAELIFDMGLGDIFSVRVAGNVISPQILGSMEYGISQAGSRLLMVVGHTGCGAVTASVQLANQKKTAKEATGCEHIDSIVTEVGPSIDATKLQSFNKLDATQQAQFVDDVASLNVLQTVQSIRRRSKILRELEESGEILIVGAMYNIRNGEVIMISDSAVFAAKDSSQQMD